MTIATYEEADVDRQIAYTKSINETPEYIKILQEVLPSYSIIQSDQWLDKHEATDLIAKFENEQKTIAVRCLTKDSSYFFKTFTVRYQTINGSYDTEYRKLKNGYADWMFVLYNLGKRNSDGSTTVTDKYAHAKLLDMNIWRSLQEGRGDPMTNKKDGSKYRSYWVDQFPGIVIHSWTPNLAKLSVQQIAQSTRVDFSEELKRILFGFAMAGDRTTLGDIRKIHSDIVELHKRAK